MNGDRQDTWEVFGTCLSPRFEYLQSLCNWCASRRVPDVTLTFRFAALYTATDESVHESRLLFAGGPLAALATRDFRERTERLVALCEDDDPDTFAVIRDFLYGKEISLAGRGVERLFSIAGAAHRWELLPLFRGLCFFVVDHDLIVDTDKLLSAVRIVALDGVPKQFRYYFWERTAAFFAELAVNPEEQKETESKAKEDEVLIPDQNEGAVERVPDLDMTSASDDAQPIELKLCPRFPGIWDLALAHNMLPQLIGTIEHSASLQVKVDLLDLVMRYLEPLVTDEDDVFQLIELLRPDSMRQEYLLGRPEESARGCSARAIRLLAKSLIAPSRPRYQMSFSWITCLWNITPCRVNFLYGPCTAELNYGGFGSTEPPRVFNSSSSVHLHIETVSAPGEQVTVKVKWTVGAIFPFKYKRIEVDLSLLERNGCKCPYGQVREDNRCLYRITKTISLAKKGEFGDKIGEEIFESLCRTHNSPPKCPVMALLHVQLVDT